MGNIPFLMHLVASTVDCKQTFLGLLPWDYYLTVNPSSCSITTFTVLGAHSSLLLIMLAIVDDLFRVVGLLAVVFVIFAGAKFILSQGSPDEAAKARTTIINALVGIGISVVSIALVSFVGAQIGKQGGGSVNGGIDLNSLPNPAGTNGANLIHLVLSLAFGVLGAIAFLVIVIAGFQYVLSQGDAQATARARSTIIYAIVGLLVAVVAQSIVSFALSHA